MALILPFLNKSGVIIGGGEASFANKLHAVLGITLHPGDYEKGHKTWEEQG